MIALHIVIYETDEGAQRFKVMVPVDDSDEVTDVTNLYEVAATTEEGTGRIGFTVFKRLEES